MHRQAKTYGRLTVRTNRTATLAVIQLVVLAAIISGCAGLWLSYYDPTTFRNLTALKPKIATLYETFTRDPLNQEKIAEARLELAQIYEYEKGKGESNRETTRQVEIIRDMFERHLKDRQQATWKTIFMEEKRKNIEDAFDIAIKTERLKNKNE